MLIKLLHQIVTLLSFLETHFFLYEWGTDGSEGVGYRVAFHGTVAVILHCTVVHAVFKTYVSIDITEENILKTLNKLKFVRQNY